MSVRAPFDKSNASWRDFIDRADGEWAAVETEEEHIRKNVLPHKELAYPTPVSHPELITERNVPMQTRDGVTLRADIVRPAAAGKFPTILMRTPYDKLSSLDYSTVVMRHLAERGYATIIQDVRGRYTSDGEFLPRVNEVDDGYDTVEWTAAQKWCDGNVGMWGISYQGFTSLTAAISNPPHLRCIFPTVIGLKYLAFRNGTFALQGRSAWLIWMQGRDIKNPLRIDFEHLPLNEIDDKAGHTSPLFKALVTMDIEKVRAAEVPFGPENLAGINSKPYLVAGWFDELFHETIANWPHLVEADPSAQLMIGPWHHNLMSMEEPKIGAIPTVEPEMHQYLAEMEQFFAIHLKGSTEPNHDGPVKLYVMGDNQWRYEQEWPLARTQYTPFYLHGTHAQDRNADGGLLDTNMPFAEEPSDHFDYDPLQPVSWPPSIDVWEYLHSMGSCHDVEARNDVLVYSSEVLQHDVEVTGSIKVTLYASTDGPDTDFSAVLIDAHPDGHSQYLTGGIVRGRYRNGTDEPQFLTPGRVNKFDFEIGATSNVFKKGHRVRIAVSSSDFSRYPRNQNTADPVGASSKTRVARQTVFHTHEYPSHVILPLIALAPIQRLTILVA